MCFEQRIQFHRKHGLNRQLLSIVEAKVDQNIVSARRVPVTILRYTQLRPETDTRNRGTRVK